VRRSAVEGADGDPWKPENNVVCVADVRHNEPGNTRRRREVWSTAKRLLTT
jgi:hypothetical protein